MNPTLRLAFPCPRIISQCFTALAFLLPLFASAQLNVTLTGTSPTCFGWANGQVSAAVTGGTAPYLYAWSNGFSGQTIQSLPAGTYAVTVTSADGQTGSASFNLTQPAELVASISLANSCAGAGNATASAVGGTGSYAYAWDNGATSASVSGLSTGLHCVTITDASGCQDVACTTITGPMTINMVVQGLACFNFCDASVEAVVTGGTAPYSYNWSNGYTGSVNQNLGPGTYDVTVTDANGCTVTGSATVGNPVQLSVNVSVTNPSCTGGGLGSATASAAGGTAPYSYLWSNGAVTQTISGLPAGTYTVTVVDFVGCTGTANAAIIPQSNLNINISATPSSACGTPTGSASATVTGGTAPLSFQWSTGGTGSSISGLVPGTYGVTVTDANGCGANAQVTVAGTPAIDLNITGVSAGCAANGSANAMVTPGTGTAPYAFLWNTGATTPIINNITAGTYSVTVTDANGCTATEQVTVTGSSNIFVTATGSIVSCFGSSNGTATATVSGATGTISYLWSNGGMTQTINGLPTGTYFVTVTDQSSGCTANTSAFVSQPTQVTVSATGVNGACNTLGSASAVAAGGTAPYTYKWSNNATTASITGLASGVYAVTATDANGCVAMGMVSITNSTAGLTVTATVTSPITAVNANNGAVSTTVSGGTAPYSYAWSNGATTANLTNLGPGTYTVTVTSTDGCTGTSTVTLTEPSCIGDRVWNDMDRDGCQDSGEIGVGGVQVTLTGTTSAGVAVNLSTVTALTGFYQFNNLAPGAYQVQFGLPAGFAFSPANACTDDFSDSDVSTSGATGTINLMAGNCNVTVDAGIYDDCINVSTAGTICCDQYLCGPGNDPAPITSTTPATGGGSAVQYMWMYTTIPGPYDPNTWLPLASATNASYDPGPLSETTYFIRCAKAALCDDWKESNIVTITVGDDAVAEINGTDAPCVGDVVTYSATSNGAGASYTWNFGPNATPSTSTSQNPTVTWNQWGVVYVTLTVTLNGCTSSDVMGVFVSNDPTFCGDALVMNVNNMGNAVMVEWEASHNVGNYEFAVQRSADGVHFETIASVPQAGTTGTNEYAYADYFPKSGNAFYRLDVREAGQHVRYSNVERVQRFSRTNNFLVYPNPASSFLTIESSDAVKTAVQVEVLNFQGAAVESLNLESGNMYQQFDLSQLGSGTYFLRIRYNDGLREVIKFVKN